MKKLLISLGIIGKATFGCLILFALVTCVASPNLSAKPVTYTGFTITDGKLGDWEFHDAWVYLTYRGDTSNVRTMLFPLGSTPTDGITQVEVNVGGVTTVTIVTAERTEHAKFDTGQIFVSLDLGDIYVTGPLPLTSFYGARGVGFGSGDIASGVFEAAYPLGIEDGTVDWGDTKDSSSVNAYASPELAALPIDLKHNTAYSGRAWVCVGFPRTPCGDPHALQTNKGALLLYQTYQSISPEYDTLNGGFFTTQLGEGPDIEEADVATEGHDGNDRSAHIVQPIVYTGTLNSNATLGGRHYDHAQIYISFEASSLTVESFQDANVSGYRNDEGQARLKIVTGRKVINAIFERGQLYVYFDKTNGSVGFGSNAGGPGYPFSITTNEDFNGLVAHSLIGAVTDILKTPSNSVHYSSATSKLSSDLRSPTLLAGGVSSCVSFNPATSICSDLTPVALKTSEGDFYLSQPYNVDTTANNGTQPYSINWGIFWAERPAKRDD